MPRTKTSLKRIENLSARIASYNKRKDALLTKAHELSILCEIDCGAIIFSPEGHVATFSSNGRVEDTLLRFLRRPNELKGGPVWNEKYLSSRLEQARNEAEMIQKMEKLQGLDDTIYKLNGRLHDAEEKMRHYNPDVENMTSLSEVEVYQQFLEKALGRIEEAKEKLFLDGIEQQADDMIEDTTITWAVVDKNPSSTGQETSTSHESDNSNN